MKRSKGMTLLELLIAMGLSAMIMAATFVIVRFSAATYDNTADMIKENNNTYDAVSILNRYIRTSSFCALSDNQKSIFISVDDSFFGENTGEKRTIRIAYDAGDKTLFIDRMDGSAKMVVSDNISDMEWTVVSGGVKYRAFGNAADGSEKLLFSGFVYKRGR